MATLNTLLAVSSIDGRYHEITEALNPYMSELGLIKYRVKAECVHLLKLSEHGVVRQFTEAEKDFLRNLSVGMGLREGNMIKRYEEKTRHDVNAMVKWLKQQLKVHGMMDVVEKVHYLPTSEDINNVAYRLQLKDANQKVMLPALRKMMKLLAKMAREWAEVPILGRTHGRAAVPLTMGKVVADFLSRLYKEYLKLTSYCFTGKSNGAVGCYNAHTLLEPEVDWVDFSQGYATSLGLMPNLWTTQINPPEDIIEFLQIWQRVSNIIINLSHDLWRYISDDWFVQANRKGQVGSSTMAQKINPTNDENAAGNFKKMNGLAWVFAVELPESRLQRDLEDSTVMRELGQIMSYCLIGLVNIEKGLKEISLNEKVIETALNRDWAILSEAVQLMLRKKTNLRDPYTLVKTFFRGREQTTAEDYHNWIKSLKIDDQTKTDLLDLTPEKYLGLAATLTKKLLEEVEPMLMLD